ncbi:uncharacterized protein LOC106757910 [Rhizophagus irregularis DAOM 181602=DAOM 197198]|nr:uncharacterized protein LOC106757910 [Rhizophagus irregularis DAOM 181602=DAOM 197198]
MEYDKEKPNLVPNVKHRIVINKGQTPILQKGYRETLEKKKFIKKEIEKMLKVGRIRLLYSPWASPVTLANKKSGLFEFNVSMPFGLKNAQRLMNNVLYDFIGDFVEVYIDDIMIHSKNFEDHIIHVTKVLQEHNLVVKLKKSRFCKQQIEFLGHEIGKDGIKPNSKKVEIIKKDVPYEWTDEQQNTFEWLKQCLTESPSLSHPNSKKKFILITDASADELEAILVQKNDKNKELFKIITNHAALKSLVNEKIPKGRCARWIMKLQQYDFFVEHRPGKKNGNADALSRLKYKQ